ncbi:MAG: NAD-dependent deacetylase, partial [Alphaproteobacteria bacterium]|nr:NAD-dependent deacetylase [Alphaproteobacteria bacterium]
PEKVIELHGNASYAKCLECGERHELEALRESFLKAGEIPYCRVCGGLVKTATISFGQSMPQAEMARAEAETLACDLFLVLGSSLVVYPAAGFPLLARRNGARLAIVNREATELDAYADLVLHDEIGPALSEVVAAN